jgi:Tfp pilus assembly protein PilX
VVTDQVLAVALVMLVVVVLAGVGVVLAAGRIRRLAAALLEAA